jgi:hypothetical protein
MGAGSVYHSLRGVFIFYYFTTTNVVFSAPDMDCPPVKTV